MHNRSIQIQLFIIATLTLLLYWPTLGFDFVNFDDQVYVLNNPFIQNPTLQNLFNGSETGNFHPITMLSLYLDQFLGNGAAKNFHFTNMLLHLLNSLLVFELIRKLFPKASYLPFFVAVLFAIHPLHIESVAWVTSRKDVLYTLFYLTVMWSYIKYIETEHAKYVGLTLLLGILAIFSKPTAITLPVALWLILFLQQKNNLLKKHLVIYGLLTLASVFVAYKTFSLQSVDAVNSVAIYGVVDRIGFAGYGICYYMLNALFPSNLAPMHPFPSKEEMQSMGYIFMCVLGIIVPAGIAWWNRKKPNLLFALGLFLLSLMLTLQLVSVGRAIVSERYTYFAYIGLFLLIGLILHKIPFFKDQPKALLFATAIVALPQFFIAKKHVPTWQNSHTLWTKAIEVHPTDWYGYIGRGNYAEEVGDYIQALSDFQQAIQVAPQKFQNYFNLGDLQFKVGLTSEAVQTYTSAIAINPNYADAYINRGQFYLQLNQSENALSDFNQALALEPTSPIAITNRGNVYLQTGQTNLAIADFTQAINNSPTYAAAWYNRGTAQSNTNPQQAISDLSQAINLDPSYFDAYNNLGSVYYNLNDFNNAKTQFQYALQINSQAGNVWLNLSIVHFQLGDYRNALQSAQNAKNTGTPVSSSFLDQIKKQL